MEKERIRTERKKRRKGSREKEEEKEDKMRRKKGAWPRAWRQEGSPPNMVGYIGSLYRTES